MIRDFIHERCGIFFADNKQYLLENRLQRRMDELAIRTVRDYLYHLKYDTSRNEFSRLIDLITTNETSFFRNEPQLLSFSEEVLPLLLEHNRSLGRKSLRIWSAGCSTGEEPYTLAMLIREQLPEAEDWRIEIVANDISDSVLKKARAGVYSGAAAKHVSEERLTRFFVAGADGYRVGDDIKSLVRFSRLNLNDQRKTALINDVDVVFCRNVMIYFSDTARRRLVRGFFSSLRPGGYLYLGHSETLHGVSKAFNLTYLKNALVYQKASLEAGSSRIEVAQAAADGTCPTSSSGASRALDLLASIGKVTEAADV